MWTGAHACRDMAAIAAVYTLARTGIGNVRSRGFSDIDEEEDEDEEDSDDLLTDDDEDEEWDDEDDDWEEDDEDEEWD